MQTPHYSVKQTGSSLPLHSTCTAQNSLDNAEVCLPPMQGSLPQLTDSTTGHRMCLRVTQQQGYTLPHLLKLYWKPLKCRHLYNPDTQWWSRNRGVPL